MRYLLPLCLLFAGFLSTSYAANLQNIPPQHRFQFSSPRSPRSQRWLNAQKSAESPRAKKRAEADQSARNAKSSLRKSAPSATPGAPAAKLGLLSALQIPAGGGVYNGSEYFSGDFNGDGKLDLVSLVENNSSSPQYSISVLLGNGNGTFQTGVLTGIPQNDNCALILVADVNGDHKDDIIVVHEASCVSGSSVDVLLSNGDGTFTVGNNYPVSNQILLGGIVADVNGDSKLDLVAVDDAEPAKVWTLLGNGDGTFQTATSVTLPGPAGNGALFADLNGDGLLDIAYMDSDSNQLDIYLATSATAYASSVSYNTSDGVYDACSLSAGDLTADGKPELVNTNCRDGNITVYVNNGDGTFQTGVYYDAATIGANSELDPGAVAIADVNGDGKADIVVTNMNSSDVTILFGNGDGTVTVPSVGYATGGYAGNPAVVADFNGDGYPDIVVADYSFSLVFLKGYGDGTFHAAVDYYPSTVSDSPSGVGLATGDFNGDGNPDYVMGNCCAPQAGITVFLSRSDGSLLPGVNYFSANSNQELLYVAVADFNEDGKLDIAAADTDNNLVQIFSGAGDGTFTLGPSLTSGISEDEARGILVSDFNHDGFPDIAVANLNDGTQDVGILLNDGTGNFASVATYSLSNSFDDVGMAAGDLNKDGKLDLAVPLLDGGEVAILLGNGDGTFQAETDLTIPSNNPVGATIADFNGDGNLDIAVTAAVRSTTQGLYVALGNGDGTFNTPVFYASTEQDQTFTLPYPQYIQAIDMDGDGKLDLVYTNSNYSTVGIVFGAGDGTFGAPVEFPAGQYAYGFAIADLNHDGTPDVVTGDDDFAGVSVLFNLNGSGTQSNYGVTTTTPSATVSAGGSATYDLTITPANHYNGTVTMSCGTLPAFTSCSFVPATFQMDGHTPVPVQLTVTTTAVGAAIRVALANLNPAPQLPSPPASHRGATALLAGFATLGLVGIVFCGPHKSSLLLALLFAFLAAPTLLSLNGCDNDCDDNAKKCVVPSAATTAAVQSSQNPAVAGQPVTFTGTITSSSGTPTGTVTFLDGTNQIGTGTLSSGAATFQTSSLSVGTHSITVTYAGDSSFQASTSPALTETIQHGGTPAGVYTIPINATGTAGTNGGNTGLHNLSVTLTVQ